MNRVRLPPDLSMTIVVSGGWRPRIVEGEELERLNKEGNEMQYRPSLEELLPLLIGIIIAMLLSAAVGYFFRSML